MRAQKNASTDSGLRELRRALEQDPSDGHVRAALIGALTRTQSWGEIAHLAARAPRDGETITVVEVGVAGGVGSRPVLYEIAHTRQFHHPAEITLAMAKAVEEWAFTGPLREIDSPGPLAQLAHGVRDHGMIWHDLLGLVALRPVLERAGFRVLGEVSADVFVEGNGNTIEADRRRHGRRY